MGRIKTSRERKSEQYNLTKVVIAPEGVSTEVDYFKGIEEYFNSYKGNLSKRFEQLIDLCVIKRGEIELTDSEKKFAIGSSAPESVVKYASNFLEERHPEFDKETDLLFVLLDTDKWTDKSLAAAQTLCRQKKYELIISNPAFEVWLLLHYLDISSLDDDEKLLIKSNAKEHPKQQESFLKVKLKQHVSGFSYCNLQPRDFLPKISTALKNAEKLCPPDSGWEGGPFTQIPKLINALPEIN